MTNLFTRRSLMPILAGLILCTVAIGCGGVEVKGTVTLDGAPLKQGVIGFVPESGPMAQGEIRDGSIKINQFRRRFHPDLVEQSPADVLESLQW